MKRNFSIIIWAIAIVLVLLASYTFYSKNKPSVIPPPQNTEVKNSSAASGNPIAPDFTLKDLNGNDVKLSDYKGKVVVLNFWAVWCKYCKEEMPDFNELNKELEKENKAVILAVNVQESPDTVKKYITPNNINLKIALDQEGSVAQSYGVSSFPTTFIINKDGTVYTYIPGLTDKETVRNYIKKAENGEPLK